MEINKSLTVYLLIALMLVSTGCVRGILYNNTVEPFCKNMQNTPTSEKSSTSELKQLSIPRIPGAQLVWNSNSIADAAAREGITTVEYCDKKRFSILAGLWGNEAITVYGK